MLNKKTGLLVLLATITAGELWAGSLTSYAIGDVLVCFRKTTGGANDLVVNAGPISTFTNATPNQRIPITQYDGSQLAFVGTNSISWSAFTWFDDTVSPNYMLFVSRGRLSLNTQTAPWPAKSANAQTLAVVDMATIPPGAADNLGFKVVNTTTAIVEPDDTIANPNGNYVHGQSYNATIQGNTGNSDFGGDFSGNPEKTTAANFTTSGAMVRSDFYQIPPTGSGSVRFLGYFEFNTNGAMTYVAYPSAVPVIKSISRSGNTSTINYTTGLYGAYTLRGTNSAGLLAPKSTWPPITVLASGDTVTHTIPDTTTDTNRFYIITAQ